MQQPLADKLRPDTLDDIFGQKHILSNGKMLRRMIEADTLSSIVLYGPPGTGKTTIASVIAKVTNCNFKAINATTAGKADMVKITTDAIKDLKENDKRTIMFIDEIHRFNKAQQDYLLPFVENGTIVLIGATTENPYFEINGALLSRSQIFELQPLDKEAMSEIIDRAMLRLNLKDTSDKSSIDVILTPEAKDFFINVADGDARQVLNALDLAVRTTPCDENLMQIIDLKVASECIQKKIRRYDKNGDNHYDSISAFIESVKHSEVDAALFYLARMLDRGEDPKYIARRLIVIASRDIGVADPNALDVCVNAFLAVERVGMPECADSLAMATIYTSLVPKSNSVTTALQSAMEDAHNLANIEIPNTLKDESYKSAHKLGHGGVSDVFASPFKFKYDGFECMPDELLNKHYYEPGRNGFEPKLAEYKAWCAELKKTLMEHFGKIPFN